MRIAVSGAGIAGLTAALALAARGFSVEVFERAPRLEEIGAGIQLAPNAMAVLERLGIARDLGGLCEPDALELRDAQRGSMLARLPLGGVARKRYGAPYCTLHRADLLAGLLAAAQRERAIKIHLQCEVEDVRSADDAVAFSAGGAERSCDILVGADGVHSSVRTAFFGHPGARPLGRSAWRATVPAIDFSGIAPLGVTGLWLGAGAHLVHYPVRGGESLNVVAIAAGDGPTPPTAPFGNAARRLIGAVGQWTPSPLLDVDAARAWARGRVVLVGDAAHAMAPSAAQGGAQAIEDAWVLAESLARAQAPETSLVEYETLRRPRVERIVRESRRNLKTYELSGVPAVLRDGLLRTLPASLFISRLDWLFGWRPE